jgi:hypothetical protein
MMQTSIQRQTKNGYHGYELPSKNLKYVCSHFNISKLTEKTGLFYHKTKSAIYNLRNNI